MSKCFETKVSKRLGLLLFACMFLAGSAYAPNASAFVRVAAGSGYELSTYDLLSEYGEWINLDPFGVVWCPYYEDGWAPFSDGRWIWTNYGWAWDSYEPFGEIVYHYGYWYWADDIGWFWVPGDEWSPARVQWYSYLNYYGWAPIPPPNYFWPDPWDPWGHDIWIIVYEGDFCDGHVGHHGIAPDHYRNIIERGHIAKRPPDLHRVETVTHRQILIRDIEKRPIDLRRDQIEVADRSVVKRDVRSGSVLGTLFPGDNGRNATTLPRTVTPKKDVKTSREIVARDDWTVRPALRPIQREERERPAVTRGISRSERAAEVTRIISRPAGATEASRSGSQSERRVVDSRASSEPQRAAAESRQAVQSRQATESRQSARVERRAEAPAPPARSEQATSRHEAPARSDPPAQSRTVERGSSGDDKAAHRGR